MKRIFFRTICCFLVSFYITSAYAEVTNQVWSSFLALPRLNEHVRFWVEGQARFSNNASRFSQGFIRPGVGYDLTENSSVWVGYGWFETTVPYTPSTVHEDRIWQQFLWVKGYSKQRWFSRSRLEQRFIPNTDTAWRFRQLFRFEHALVPSKHYIFAASNELFYNFNDFNDNQSHGLDQNRLYVGLGARPTKRLLVEAGYLNQTIRRVGRDNFTGHSLLISLLWS